MKHDNLLHTVAYALRWVINGFTEMGDPDIYYAPQEMIDVISETLGESEVNDEILRWCLDAKIGDTWREDDLIITRI